MRDSGVDATVWSVRSQELLERFRAQLDSWTRERAKGKKILNSKDKCGSLALTLTEAEAVWKFKDYESARARLVREI